VPPAKPKTRSTTFRLAPETIADLNTLANLLCLRSRSEALRYAVRSSCHQLLRRPFYKKLQTRRSTCPKRRAE
jgi:hypothetical protein